jgi:cysteine synthase
MRSETTFLSLDGKVNALIMSTGTAGTLAGASMFLKEKNPKIRTVLADPPVSPSSAIILLIESIV